MPRKSIIRTAEYPYHVTARCINREWFRVPLPTVWTIFSDWLAFVSRAYELKIYSFVLMSNHFHLLAQTPKANLDSCMNYLLREVSRSITFESGRINQTFGGPYHWSVLTTEHHFRNVYKYIYINPVLARMTRTCEQYPMSTLRGLIGLSSIQIPLVADPYLLTPKDLPSLLGWLNEVPENQDDVLATKRALNKPVFRYCRQRNTGRPHHLETRTL